MKTCLIVYVNHAHGFRGPAESIQKGLEHHYNVKAHCIDLLAYLGAHKTDDLWKKGGVKDAQSSRRNWITYNYTAKIAWIGYELEYLLIRGKLKKCVDEMKPDFIISTHFLSNGIIGRFLKHYKLDIPFFAYNAEVLHFHRTYMNSRIDEYISPTIDGAQAVVDFGVKPERSITSAYPLDEKFIKAYDSRTEERKKLGLDDMFTVLISFGGSGIGSLEVLDEAVKRGVPVQFVVLCGRNTEAAARLGKIADNHTPVKIVPLGFITNMQDYMYCCDMSAGKAGMNTTFESIYMRRPFIVTKALVNERVNVNLIVKNGLGWEPRNAGEFMDIVERAIEQPEMIETCKQNMEKIPYVFSAEQLASDVLTRYHARKRLSEVTTLFFDLAGTLCDIPISHIWESVNEEGFRSVLDAIGYADKADSAQMGKLTSQFIEQKKQLRTEAKKSLKEFYLGTQLDDFFRQASREDTLLATVLEQLDLGQADRLDMFDSVYMRSELDITRPFSGVVKTLKNLSKHYDLYLLSNNASRQLVHGIIEKIGVKGLFKDVFISCDLGHRKPDSRFIEPILKKTGISAAQIAMIGDRLGQDIAMAQKVGMVSIFMSAEEHEDNEGVSIPYDYEVKTLEGLERLLRKK